VKFLSPQRLSQLLRPQATGMQSEEVVEVVEGEVATLRPGPQEAMATEKELALQDGDGAAVVTQMEDMVPMPVMVAAVASPDHQR